jgi:fumarylacetoacetase
LPYLAQLGANNYDIELQVALRSAAMNDPVTICATNFRYMYWSSVQQLLHHASSGCAMQVGDLLGSGTVSGPDQDQRGSLLEISWNGATPFPLPSGERRTFLEDGDSLIMRGHCTCDGLRIGFGEVEGTVLPAK